MEEHDAYILTQSGQNRRLETTKVWVIFIKWKYGTTIWEPLVSYKGSNTVDVTQFEVPRELHDDPDFAWWVTYTIKNHTHIIATVNNQYHKRTHKFGVRISKSVDDVYLLDKTNDNTYLAEAI